ncbi:hypothetical protein KKE60_07965 [Patescibacteria group bacterium]|nr:hypothetical protein [Patescibacteria group bacterium]
MSTVGQITAVTNEVHTPTDQERATAQRLREAYEYMVLAKRNMEAAFGEKPTAFAQPYWGIAMDLLGYARGTIGFLVGDLETGRYPYRSLQVEHPALIGARGHESKDRR